MSHAQHWQTVGQWEEYYEHDRMDAPVTSQQLRTEPGTIMPKISEMLPSSYLKQSDFEEDLIVTVRAISQSNIAMEGKPPEIKWLLHFHEFEKPMVLNSTNIQLMGKACDSDDTDDWINKQVVVYVDPNVSFGGELVGGLRIRKHKIQAAPKAAPPRVAVHNAQDSQGMGKSVPAQPRKAPGSHHPYPDMEVIDNEPPPF